MRGETGPHSEIADFDEPVLLLSLPDERILLASPAAARLLTGGADPGGRPLHDFAPTPDGNAAELLRRGHLTGYQQRRARAGGPTDPLELRVRALVRQDPGAPVLAMLSDDGAGPQPTGEPVPTVVGWVDQQLGVRWIGPDPDQLLATSPQEAVGRSVLELVSPDDLASLLFAVGQAVLDGHAVSLSARLAGAGERRHQLVLVPQTPAPSFAFSLQPEADPPRSAQGMRAVLHRFGDGLAAATSARTLSAEQRRLRPALPELTGREMQIVSRLLAGDRVPAIAGQLYLAQSTVRNHLSAVFAKLGVRSQQELIVLLRTTRDGSG